MDDQPLTVLDVLALHAFIMEQLGEQPKALYDNGEAKLESAILRPVMATHYQQANLAVQAALLISGIAMAHAFLDGNKRTALIVGDTYLRRHTVRLNSPQLLALAKEIEHLAAHTERGRSLEEAETELAAWLASYCP